MSLDYLGYELKELKATDNSGGGVFSGYASTWDKDLYDDVVVKGAFEQTLSADFKNGGAGIPIHWQHTVAYTHLDVYKRQPHAHQQGNSRPLDQSSA